MSFSRSNLATLAFSLLAACGAPSCQSCSSCGSGESEGENFEVLNPNAPDIQDTSLTLNGQADPTFKREGYGFVGEAPQDESSEEAEINPCDTIEQTRANLTQSDIPGCSLSEAELIGLAEAATTELLQNEVFRSRVNDTRATDMLPVVFEDTPMPSNLRCASGEEVKKECEAAKNAGRPMLRAQTQGSELDVILYPRAFTSPAELVGVVTAARINPNSLDYVDGFSFTTEGPTSSQRVAGPAPVENHAGRVARDTVRENDALLGRYLRGGEDLVLSQEPLYYQGVACFDDSGVTVCTNFQTGEVLSSDKEPLDAREVPVEGGATVILHFKNDALDTSQVTMIQFPTGRTEVLLPKDENTYWMPAEQGDCWRQDVTFNAQQGLALIGGAYNAADDAGNCPTFSPEPSQETPVE